MPENTIHILFFGRLGELAEKYLNKNELTLPWQTGFVTAEDLITAISSDHQELLDELGKNTNLVSINQAMSKLNAPVNAGDEVAFMSPLSGG
ncbi:MAG: MoaD/ThiS family protein [Arenicella sp.]